MKVYTNIKQDKFSEVVQYFPEIDKLLETGLCLLGGGSLRTLIDWRDTIKDIDLFFTQNNNVEEVKTFLKESGYNEVFACPKGELFTYKKGEVKVQLICKRFYADLYDLVNSFDIVACCAGWDGDKLVTHNNWVKDIKLKQITFNQITYPVATIARVYKYLKKGYHYSPTSLADLVIQINEGKFDGDQLALYVD